MWIERCYSPTGLSAAAVVLTSLVACDAEPEPESIEPRNYVVYNGSGWGCRSCGYANSPVLGENPLGTVATAYDPSAPLSLMWAISPNGEEAPVAIDESGIFTYFGGAELRGTDLIDWVLVFGDGEGVKENVRIAHADEQDDWVEGLDIMTYQLFHQSWEGGELVETDVCPGFEPDMTTVTVIYGETYKEPELTPMPHPRPATCACRGHVLAKMKFMGKGPSYPHDAYNATREQRHATIRMLRADYCGNGESYTEVGQPLEWLDAAGYFTAVDNAFTPEQVEARWTHEGAQCLNHPRATDRASVHCHVPLPPCSEDALDLSDIDWLSINP